MILNSESSLVIIAQALDEYRHRIRTEIDTQVIPPESRFDHENILMKVECVLDTVEAEYNLLRKEKPAMMPFDEIIRYKR